MGDMVLSASTACFAGATMEAALATAADMGFRAVELTLWGEAFHSVGRLPGMWWREAGEAERRVLRQAIEAFEVVDGHLPFVNCPLVSANKFVEELGRELIAEALDALAGLGGRVGVFHVAPCPVPSYADLADRLADACRWLGDRAGKAGVRVALETGYPVGDAFAELIDAVEHPAVGACLDVGHLSAAVGREQRNTDRGAEAYNTHLLGVVWTGSATGSGTATSMTSASTTGGTTARRAPGSSTSPPCWRGSANAALPAGWPSSWRSRPPWRPSSAARLTSSAPWPPLRLPAPLLKDDRALCSRRSASRGAPVGCRTGGARWWPGGPGSVARSAAGTGGAPRRGRGWPQGRGRVA